MKRYTVTFMPQGKKVTVPEGTTLLQAQIASGLSPDAPCGGKGTCGKCRVLADGAEVLACQTVVDRDRTVALPEKHTAKILTGSILPETTADGTDDYALAFDIGTTTVVCYLLDGKTGAQLAQSSAMNPQQQYGADVISRIQEVLDHGGGALSGCIRETMAALCREVCRRVGIAPEAVTVTAIVGNTAMHHLLLNIDPKPLVTPPYMPSVSRAMELPGGVRVLPNIAGFVGGDTVGCLVATRFDRREKLTLLIDIGTNGEMVLGNKARRIACSTAAGPAFEGARISCGMRGAEGAVDHVWLEDGAIRFHVIGDTTPLGLCGSGILDLTAVLLETGTVTGSGRMPCGAFALCENVVLTQKDVREVQLAKAAIRAGIELLAQTMGAEIPDIQQVLLAGAFGSYMDPRSACRIGMIPPALEGRIEAIGNAAGEGAKLCALSRAEFAYSQRLADTTEFLELASLPRFQDCYVDALEFEEESE